MLLPYFPYTFALQFNPMKKTLPVFACILVFAFLSNTSVFSQATVVSTTGYSVNIVVIPKAIVPTSNTCVNGFNYNVRFDYSVTFSGTNIPSSLYTLQGTLGCGSSSHFFNIPNNQSAGSVTSQSNVWRGVSDCSTASLATLNCNIIKIEIHGPGITSRIVTYAVSNSPLPVKLVSFDAESLKEKVRLTWSTSSEINSDNFIVERSADGNSWSAIKTIKAGGNSSVLLNYEASDDNPLKGTAYYRLKQIDIDGSFEYSMTRTAKYTGSAIVDIYPVPNTGNTVNFKGITDFKNTTITVRNAAGMSLYVSNLNSNSAQLPTLKPGLYVISLTNKITGENTNLRYIKI